MERTAVAQVVRSRRGLSRAMEGSTVGRLTGQFMPHASITSSHGTLLPPQFAEVVVALDLTSVEFSPAWVRLEPAGRVRELGDYRWYGASNRHYIGTYTLVWERARDGLWRLAFMEWSPQS